MPKSVALCFRRMKTGSDTPLAIGVASSLMVKKPFCNKKNLALVWEIMNLIPYIDRERFIISTSPHSSRWLISLADASIRVARWLLRLSKFDSKVRYVKVEKSRYPMPIANCRQKEKPQPRLTRTFRASLLKMQTYKKPVSSSQTSSKRFSLLLIPITKPNEFR